ncbi:restriction endonuclease subunit S, partial [Collinsella tanakaei]|nr:restriction endonuclease subunit S [Collinsella tanakaei]
DGRRYEKRVDAKGRESEPVCIEDEIPFEIPEGWAWARLGSIISLIPGTSYRKNEIKSNGIRILRGTNITSPSITLFDDDVFLPLDHFEADKKIRKGDIIIVASTGSMKALGRVGFSDLDYENVQIGAFLRIARPISDELVPWVKLTFLCPYYQQYIRLSARGTSINNIRESILNMMLVPIPPYKEQGRIAERCGALLELLN